MQELPSQGAIIVLIHVIESLMEELPSQGAILVLVIHVIESLMEELPSQEAIIVLVKPRLYLQEPSAVPPVDIPQQYPDQHRLRPHPRPNRSPHTSRCIT